MEGNMKSMRMDNQQTMLNPKMSKLHEKNFVYIN